MPAPSALAFASLLAAAAQSAPAGLAELEERLVAEVNQERLLRTVRELVALGPRMGGTPSGAAAARYHAQRLRAAGLEPRAVADPEVRAFQTLSLTAVVTAGDEALELADGCLAQHTSAIESSELELRASPPALGEHDGVPYALFVEEQGLRGALSIERARAPRVILVGCARRLESSAAVLHQPAGCSGTILTCSARESRWLRERLHGAAAADPAGGGALPATSRRLTLLSIEAKVFDGPGKPLTAWAEVPGERPDAPILLYCAHGDSDSGGPGADDNASGDAVVLELAAAFAALSKSGPPLPLTLRFAIWGSEIHSSGAWFARMKQDGSAGRHVGVINFDQAGTGAERDCVYFEPDDLALNQPLVRLALAMAGERCAKEGFWSEYASNAALGGTDSYVFSPGWRRGGAKGDLPSLTIFTAAFGRAEETKVTPGFRSPGWKGDPERVRVDYSLVYHESGDRPDVTTEREPWNMAWVAKAAGLLGLKLAAAPETVKKLLDR
jgi:hypothetical protein